MTAGTHLRRLPEPRDVSSACGLGASGEPLPSTDNAQPSARSSAASRGGRSMTSPTRRRERSTPLSDCENFRVNRMRMTSHLSYRQDDGEGQQEARQQPVCRARGELELHCGRRAGKKKSQREDGPISAATNENPPGLPTMRMAARPSSFLQQDSAAPSLFTSYDSVERRRGVGPQLKAVSMAICTGERLGWYRPGVHRRRFVRSFASHRMDLHFSSGQRERPSGGRPVS
jgi:hypothetical protein